MFEGSGDGVVEGAKQVLKEQVARILKEQHKPFELERVNQAIREFGLRSDGVDVAALSMELMAEGAKEVSPIAEKFLETLEIPVPPSKVEEALRKGGSIDVYLPYPLVDTRDFLVELYDNKSLEQLGKTEPPYKWESEYLHFYASPGKVGIDFAGRPSMPFQWPNLLAWTKERAFFKTDSEEGIEKAVRTAEKLKPFLSHMGLDGMVEALEILRELKKGEARVEGPYVFARNEEYWLMRRGAILGDPELDKAALLGEEVKLGFPGDVEIALRANWNLSMIVYLGDVRLRLGEEVFEPPGHEIGFSAHCISTSPIEWAIHSGFRTYLAALAEMRDLEMEDEGYQLESFLDNVSPKVQALVHVLAEYQDPFRALNEGKLAPYVSFSSPEPEL